MTRRADESRGAPILIPLLLAITVVGAVDLVLDAPGSPLSLHVLVEALLVALSLGTAVYLWWGWRGARRSLAAARGAIDARMAERDAWRRRAEDLLRGLGEAIDEQFESWELTPVERETALQILKGHSHKRIARLGGRSERTVRQHAVSVYRKSGLGGRAELAGFFLDAVMLPADSPDSGSEGRSLTESGQSLSSPTSSAGSSSAQ